MNEDLRTSKSGINLIIQEEGLVLHVYKDQAGYPTVGVGHLLTSEEKSSGIFNNGISKEQAIELLKKDLVRTENLIKKYLVYPLNQNQFDALVSMIFNTGGAPIITGTLGKLINAGKIVEVPDEMLKWCYAGGVILPVLQKRRKREATLFQKPLENKIEPNFPEPVKPIHDVVIQERQPNLPPSETLKLTRWQKIQESFFKFFK